MQHDVRITITENLCACSCPFSAHAQFGGPCRRHRDCTHWREPRARLDALLDREIQELSDFGDQVRPRLSTADTEVLMSMLERLARDLDAAGDDKPSLFVAYPLLPAWLDSYVVARGAWRRHFYGTSPFVGIDFVELAVPRRRWRAEPRTAWARLSTTDTRQLRRQVHHHHKPGTPCGLVYADVQPADAAGHMVFCVDLDQRQYLTRGRSAHRQVQTPQRLAEPATGGPHVGGFTLAHAQHEPWSKALSAMVKTVITQ